MFHLPEMYIRIQKGKKSGKEILNSVLLELLLRVFITMQCPVSVGFVQMSEY